MCRNRNNNFLLILGLLDHLAFNWKPEQAIDVALSYPRAKANRCLLPSRQVSLVLMHCNNFIWFENISCNYDAGLNGSLSHLSLSYNIDLYKGGGKNWWQFYTVSWGRTDEDKRLAFCMQAVMGVYITILNSNWKYSCFRMCWVREQSDSEWNRRQQRPEA